MKLTRLSKAISSVISSGNIHLKSVSCGKKLSHHCPIKTILTLKRSESGSIVLALFPKASWLVLAATASSLEIPSQSCVSALQKVLGN